MRPPRPEPSPPAGRGDQNKLPHPDPLPRRGEGTRKALNRHRSTPPPGTTTHVHFRHLHPPARLHLGPRGDPGGAGHRLVQRPRRGPVPERRLPRLHRHHRAPGAGVEEMETSVTKPIEDIINTVSGIEELRSTTQRGHLHRHRPVPALEERRRRHAGGARQGHVDPREPARGDRDAADRQVRHLQHARAHHRRLGPPRLPRGHRDRPQEDQGAAGDRARRRRRQPRRRADSGHQRRRRHRQARLVQPLDRGRPHGAASRAS